MLTVRFLHVRRTGDADPEGGGGYQGSPYRCRTHPLHGILPIVFAHGTARWWLISRGVLCTASVADIRDGHFGTNAQVSQFWCLA